MDKSTRKEVDNTVNIRARGEKNDGAQTPALPAGGSMSVGKATRMSACRVVRTIIFALYNASSIKTLWGGLFLDLPTTRQDSRVFLC